MTTYDLSMNNPAIRKYFAGDDSYKPTSELVFLHTHPLVQPNFIQEVERVISAAGEKLIAKKVPPHSKVVIDLIDLTIRFGEAMGTLHPEDPEEVLSILRSLYVLCNSVLKD